MRTPHKTSRRRARRMVTDLVWSVITLALVALEVRWLAYYLDNILVAVAVTGLALVNVAAFAGERHGLRRR